MEHVEESQTTYNKDKDFTTLICWKDAREVKLYFYKKIIPKLPVEEKFNLTNQIRRAAVSVTANISEGYGRYHYQEGIQFYRIARGSLYELKDHLISCFDFEFIDKALFENGTQLIEKTKISLNGFINYTKRRKEAK
jgi:four helix bundle protein